MGRLRERLALEARVLRGKVVGTERRGSLVAVLLIAPVIAGVSWVALHYDWLSFVFFPPLAAATYNLFAHPEQPRNFPWQVPVALTVGALSGAAALNVSQFLGTARAASFQVDPVTAGVTVLLAGGFLYLFDTEIAPALAVGLLLPFAGVPPRVYVLNVFLGTTVVTVAFAAWRSVVYRDDEHRLGDDTPGPTDTGEFVFER